MRIAIILFILLITFSIVQPAIAEDTGEKVPFLNLLPQLVTKGLETCVNQTYTNPAFRGFKDTVSDVAIKLVGLFFLMNIILLFKNEGEMSYTTVIKPLITCAIVFSVISGYDTLVNAISGVNQTLMGTPSTKWETILTRWGEWTTGERGLGAMTFDLGMIISQLVLLIPNVVSLIIVCGMVMIQVYLLALMYIVGPLCISFFCLKETESVAWKWLLGFFELHLWGFMFMLIPTVLSELLAIPAGIVGLVDIANPMTIVVISGVYAIMTLITPVFAHMVLSGAIIPSATSIGLGIAKAVKSLAS
jgi:hypothetical protein